MRALGESIRLWVIGLVKYTTRWKGDIEECEKAAGNEKRSVEDESPVERELEYFLIIVQSQSISSQLVLSCSRTTWFAEVEPFRLHGFATDKVKQLQSGIVQSGPRRCFNHIRCVRK